MRIISSNEYSVLSMKDKTGVFQISETNKIIHVKNGLLHNTDGPALIKTNGTVKWYLNGILHNLNGPAVVSCNDKVKHYYVNGKHHREDGPAIISYNDEEWRKNGRRHRDDGGPAAIHYLDGLELYQCAWYKMGKLHREDGPAIIYTDNPSLWEHNCKSSKPEYYLDGCEVNFNIWYARVNNLTVFL